MTYQLGVSGKTEHSPVYQLGALRSSYPLPVEKPGDRDAIVMGQLNYLVSYS